MRINCCSLLLFIILLSACDSTAITPDLYAASADARATQKAAESGLRATDRAIQDERSQATLSAAATSGAAQVEMQLLQARIDATRQAQDLEIERARVTEAATIARATQIQAENYAQATHIAEGLQATANVAVAHATQTAVVVLAYQESGRAVRQNNIEALWDYFIPALIGILLIFLAIFAIYTAPHAARLVRTWIDRRNRHYYTPIGILVYTPGPDGLERAQLIQGGRIIPSSSSSGVISLNRSGSVLSSPMRLSSGEDHPGVNMLAMRLVQDAMTVEGPGSDTIPGHRRLDGWTSDRWQRVVGALRQAGAAVTRPGVGAFVTGEFHNLNELCFALETKKLHLRPSPPEEFDLE